MGWFKKTFIDGWRQSGLEADVEIHLRRMLPANVVKLKGVQTIMRGMVEHLWQDSDPQKLTKQERDALSAVIAVKIVRELYTEMPDSMSALLNKEVFLHMEETYGKYLGGDPEEVAQAKEVQKQLVDEFAKHGVNFMTLHPTIHRTLLREGILFGRIERSVEMFFELAELTQQEGRDDDERAAMLLHAFEERLKLIS